MSEWWTYSLSDFLMFSARTYYRQFELMNREWWPLPLVALVAGAAIVGGMVHRRLASARLAFALLCAAWLWVGWAYHLQRYADINTGAPYFAAGFFVQAGLHAWMAWKAPAPPGLRTPAAGMGLALALLTLAGYPLLAPLHGRGWWQAEVFGFAPDPTAMLTLGALVVWRSPWPLWVMPLLWCGSSTATMLELHATGPWWPAAGALLALGAVLWEKLRR
ncbi:MAG: hypothetical protein EOP92_07990 [Lysobacteraceae bacterium]|nr:MAG: hypothetical protein EOP92_07990 [Xanthomonadaceae bacterium]